MEYNHYYLHPPPSNNQQSKYFLPPNSNDEQLLKKIVYKLNKEKNRAEPATKGKGDDFQNCEEKLFNFFSSFWEKTNNSWSIATQLKQLAVIE
jgi:hypothetical protein